MTGKTPKISDPLICHPPNPISCSDESQEVACERCHDEGWVNIEHPVRAGVIAWRVPCDKCNTDGAIPDPWPQPNFTVTSVDSETVNAPTTTITICKE